MSKIKIARKATSKGFPLYRDEVSNVVAVTMIFISPFDLDKDTGDAMMDPILRIFAITCCPAAVVVHLHLWDGERKGVSCQDLPVRHL